MSIFFSKNPITKKLCSIIAVFVFVVFSGASPWVARVVAQETPPPEGAYTLLEPLPCIPGNGVTCTAGTQITNPNFETYVQYVFNLAIAIAAVSAVFMIVWGGFLYMTSEAPGVKTDGLKKVKDAIYGLLLVLCSFLILRTIDPRLVAISKTLVPPLADCAKEPQNVLCNKKSVAGDFFEQLAREAENYRIQNVEVIAEREKAKVAVAELTKNKELLEIELRAAELAGDDEAVNRLEAQIANTQNKITEVHAIAVLKSTESGILSSTVINLDNGDTSNATNNTVATIREASNLARKAYDLAKAELVKTGNSPDKIQALNNQYWPIHGSLVLQQNALQENGTVEYRINSVKRMLSIAQPQITDQVKKAQLQSDADKLLLKLAADDPNKAIYPHY